MDRVLEKPKNNIHRFGLQECGGFYLEGV